jgi:hypothetical protein
MRFGTSDHIFNIHDVQLIIIFISLTKIKDRVNTAGALQQFQTEIASLAFSRTHWARNFVCFFPFRLLYVFPGFVYKRIWELFIRNFGHFWCECFYEGP